MFVFADVPARVDEYPSGTRFAALL